MTNAQIEIIARTAASLPKLRADGIRFADLIQIGRIIAAGDDGSRHLIEALEDLGKVADGAYREGALDAALDDVATYARFDDRAVMDLSDADVRQLAEQATAALPDTGTVVHLTAQPERRAS